MQFVFAQVHEGTMFGHFMFGDVDINFDDMFELRMSTNTRGHKYKLF